MSRRRKESRHTEVVSANELLRQMTSTEAGRDEWRRRHEAFKLENAKRKKSVTLLRRLLEDVEHGHNDNTGLACRVDLVGHDCCEVCNTAETLIVAAAEYLGAMVSH